MSEKRKDDPTLLLVRVSGTEVYFILPCTLTVEEATKNGSWQQIGDPAWASFQYLIEEHSCPVNYTRFPVLEVCKRRDGELELNADPHGVLELVEYVERPDDFEFPFGFDNDDRGERARALFTHFKTLKAPAEPAPLLLESVSKDDRDYPTVSIPILWKGRISPKDKPPFGVNVLSPPRMRDGHDRIVIQTDDGQVWEVPVAVVEKVGETK